MARVLDVGAQRAEIIPESRARSAERAEPPELEPEHGVRSTLLETAGSGSVPVSCPLSRNSRSQVCAVPTQGTHSTRLLAGGRERRSTG